MTGHFFQVENLLTASRQSLKQAALAATGGAADDIEAYPARQFGESFDDLLAIALVAPLELLGIPANAPEDIGHCTAALPSAPANDQWPPVSWAVKE